MAQKKAPAKGAASIGKSSGGKPSASSVKNLSKRGRHIIPPNPPGSGIKSRHGRGRGGRKV